jgi:hypothetical protein
MIEEAWKDYALRVLPADVSKVQLQETRRAFYAGAQALMGIQCEVLDSGDEAASFTAMDRLKAELDGFKQAVLEGRA